MKIGILGGGSIGLRHAQNLLDLGHDVLVYEPKAVPDGKKYGLRNDVLSHGEAIVIASPTFNHNEDIHAVKNIGKPVFVEKPISHIWDAICFDVAMVGYNLRFHSCVKRAKKWLDRGLIGKPCWASFTCAQYNNRPAYLRDGVILNWSHEIDLALYLLGPGWAVTSSTRITGGYDDITDILLIHLNDCRTTIHLDYITEPEQRGFTIVGDRGRISTDLINRHIWQHGKIHESSGGTFDQEYIEEMQTFIDRINNIDTIGANGNDGLRALEICLQVRKQAGLP